MASKHEEWLELPGSPGGMNWEIHSSPATLKGTLQVFCHGTAVSIEYATYYAVDRIAVEKILRDAITLIMERGLLSKQFGLPVQWEEKNG